MEHENRNIPVPVLLGPTASGKTDLAITVALHFGMDIISCDSRQIYRDMNIGTAKPSQSQMDSVRHWMIDIINPDKSYSCFQFGVEAEKIIRELDKNGRKAIICGGTGLYFNSLSKGIGPTVPSSMEFRETCIEKINKNGKGYLYEELMKIDPVTAKSSHPSNIQRNIRALEVYHNTGIPLSELKDLSKPPCGIRFYVMTACLDRDELYARINRRVDIMVDAGLLDEFRSLVDMGYDWNSPGMQCVGYRELFDVETGRTSMKDAVEEIKRNTRHYAKRQLTWFRHQVESTGIDMHGNASEKVKKNIEIFFDSCG
jgi:tRNA dimethylallyltransferase